MGADCCGRSLRTGSHGREDVAYAYLRRFAQISAVEKRSRRETRSARTSSPSRWMPPGQLAEQSQRVERELGGEQESGVVDQNGMRKEPRCRPCRWRIVGLGEEAARRHGRD
jgi:hypothetical protein